MLCSWRNLKCNERTLLSRQPLLVMEEYHSLGVTQSCEILVDRWLKRSYIRDKGTDTSDLQETKEILKQKLQILKSLPRKKRTLIFILLLLLIID